ncbi:hypothetical protein LJB62_12355 [Bacillus sp. DFI.2.34]|nr:hypothetical protein [Bacillus sp. DFI.2.34]
MRLSLSLSAQKYFCACRYRFRRRNTFAPVAIAFGAEILLRLSLSLLAQKYFCACRYRFRRKIRGVSVETPLILLLFVSFVD